MRLTVAEAASLLDAPERRVYEWIEDDELPAQRIHGQYRINRTELLEWATSRDLTVAPRAFAQSPGDAAAPSLSEALHIGGIHYGTAADDVPKMARHIVSGLPLVHDGDREVLFAFLTSRDSLGLTFVADGIAVPQVRTPAILPIKGGAGTQLLSLSFLMLPLVVGGISARRAVDTIFFVVSPTVPAHVAMIAKLTAAIGSSELRAALRLRRPADEILRVVAAVEATL
jgi:PTS system nitrogen regulatory IIA component